MDPSLLFTAPPGDMNPVTFSFDRFDTGTLLEPIADFAFGFEMNGVGFVEEEVFQNQYN
jgi:hypothetical protein